MAREADHDLAGTDQTELLAREPFQRPVVAPQAPQLLAQSLILRQPRGDALADCCLLAAERAEVQGAAAAEQQRGDGQTADGRASDERKPLSE